MVIDSTSYCIPIILLLYVYVILCLLYVCYFIICNSVRVCDNITKSGDEIINRKVDACHYN